MAISANQRIVLTEAQANGGRITKKELVDKYGPHYYHNGEKYIGEILSRMVNAGLLIREKPGVYRIGKGKKSKPATVSNHPQLF